MISIFSFCSIFISILIALKYSHFASFLILKVLPNSEQLIIGFIAVIITFILSILVINKISQFFKYVIDFTLIGRVDDVAGIIFGFFTSALFISFCINIIQYFDISLFEIQIKDFKKNIFKKVKEIQSYFFMDYLVLLAIGRMS